MFNTGLKKFEDATVDNFTTEYGRILRGKLNKPWKKVLSLATSKKVIIEESYPLDKNKTYVFACNHSFDEDVISILQSLDRNAYVLNGSTDQTEHNPVFLAVWLNGMVYVNRLNNESRNNSVLKMKKLLKSGTSVMMFVEGGYNNSENQFINPPFPGVYTLAKEENVEVVPVISFNDYDWETQSFDGNIYIRMGKPIPLAEYEKYEGLNHLRDVMSTMMYDIINEHVDQVERKTLGENPREYYMQIRQKVYECQKWYNDVWHEELTVYDGHNVTPPKKALSYADNVNVNKDNAWVMAPVLERNEANKQYDLVKYLQKNLELSK